MQSLDKQQQNPKASNNIQKTKMDGYYSYPSRQAQPSQLENVVYQASEYLTQVEELSKQRTGLETFHAHLSQTTVTYLDQHKIFAIVKVSHLEKLEEVAKDISQRMLKIEAQSGSINQQTSMLRETVRSKSARVVELQQTLKASQAQNHKLQEFIKEFNNKIEESQQKRYEAGIKSEILQLKLKEAREAYEKSKIAMKDFCAQTEYIAESLDPVEIVSNVVPFANEMRRELRVHNMEIQNMSHMAVEGSDDSINQEGELSKLKANFQKILQEVTQTMNDKLSKLKEQNEHIKTWQQENDKIKAENEQLRKQLRAINEKEQQIAIWKEMMGQFISKVDDEVERERKVTVSPSAHPAEPNQSNIFYEEKISILQGQVLKFATERLEREQRLKELKDIMVHEEEMPQQNIVNSLIVLSAKVKACVQYLLEQCA